MIRLYTDAATKGNFGLGGIGILIVENGQATQVHRPLAAMSNHAAEFEAVIAGLTLLIESGRTGSVRLASDSKLVIEAMDKRYAKHYADYVTKLTALMAQFTLLLWQWVPEAQNKGAHTLAQQGLREAEALAAKRGPH
ncbi:ribonuclease HI family protein [Lacticaseibacillus daqingensis]|uniref:ribonuclease HI family protein n=1 Tax=Lacticaseibacillus daqingensis TaxID=2486014 RepID=UPI000F79EA4F|nr:ribonuclease HI family protein [Lacticaseibacillus daqingensis]